MRRNDLISKAEVLETYAELYDIFDDNAAIREELHKVYAKINSLKELEAGPKWISVKDRWPDLEGDYLVTDGHEIPWRCRMMKLGVVKGWVNAALNPQVKYWMPIPEPPKEDQK